MGRTAMVVGLVALCGCVGDSPTSGGTDAATDNGVDAAVEGGSDAGDAGDAALPPSGKPLWAYGFGGADDDDAVAVAVDKSGNVYVGGSFQTACDPGKGVLTSAGADDAVLVKLDANGTVLWQRQFGGAGVDSIAHDGIAVNAAGDVFVAMVVTGGASAATQIGGVSVAAGKLATVVARLAPSDGSVVSAMGFTCTSSCSPQGLTLDSQQRLVTGGDFSGSIDLGSGPTNSNGYDSWYARLKADLTGVDVAKTFVVTPGNQRVYGTSVDSKDDLLLAGIFEQTVSFDGSSSLTSSGGYDGFVGSIAGGVNNKVALGGLAYENAYIARADAQFAYVAGAYATDGVTFGGAPLPMKGVLDGYIVKLDATTFAHKASRRFGGPGDDRAVALLPLTSGVLNAGYYSDQAELGAAQPTASNGGLDAYVVRLDANLGNVWLQHFGGKGDDNAAAVARAADGFLAVGSYSASVPSLDFGVASNPTNKGKRDGFVVKLAE